MVRLTVRVFRITYNYTDCLMPALWEPTTETLDNLMRGYYGAEADAKLDRIDFQFVDCWHPTGDYVATIQSVVKELQPDVCVTCLDRHSSFLEIVLYHSAPLLQFEIINRSGFVKNCDVLIPNGAVEAEHRGNFHYIDAPLPQISFPIKEKVTKQTVGFRNDIYVLAVIGKDFTRRAESERNVDASLAFARTLAGLLIAEPSLGVLLVGETPARVAHWFGQAGVSPGEARVKVIEFATDLRATMLACDLIVNPPMRGGGRGMALAISDQLPTIIFPDADAANFVPADNVAKDLTDFVLKVWRYVRLGSGWRENYISRSGLVPFSPEYNHMAAQSFVEAARVAITRGRQRLLAQK